MVGLSLSSITCDSIRNYGWCHHHGTQPVRACDNEVVWWFDDEIVRKVVVGLDKEKLKSMLKMKVLKAFSRKNFGKGLTNLRFRL